MIATLLNLIEFEKPKTHQRERERVDSEDCCCSSLTLSMNQKSETASFHVVLKKGDTIFKSKHFHSL